MKPEILVKLFNEHREKVAELETINATEIYEFLNSCDFKYGTVRVTYENDVYNEATFKNKTQCKLLTVLFREKPLLKYIYNGEL